MASNFRHSQARWPGTDARRQRLSLPSALLEESSTERAPTQTLPDDGGGVQDLHDGDDDVLVFCSA